MFTVVWAPVCSWKQSWWTCEIALLLLCFSLGLLHHPSASRIMDWAHQTLWSREALLYKVMPSISAVTHKAVWRIFFVPVAGGRNVSWGTVADLWVELKDLDNVILSPSSSFFTYKLGFTGTELPVSIDELRPSKPQTELICIFIP